MSEQAKPTQIEVQDRPAADAQSEAPQRSGPQRLADNIRRYLTPSGRRAAREATHAALRETANASFTAARTAETEARAAGATDGEIARAMSAKKDEEGQWPADIASNPVLANIAETGEANDAASSAAENYSKKRSGRLRDKITAAGMTSATGALTLFGGSTATYLATENIWATGAVAAAGLVTMFTGDAMGKPKS
jgi:hypothetical protein